MNREELLQETVQPIDIKDFDVVGLVDAMSKTAFQARNLGRAAKIYDAMLQDKECTIILCLAGSLFSAGLKGIVHDLITNNMVDAIVSTGANIVDQDFFEALGYRHYVGDPFADDEILRQQRIDRIYDTYIDEDQLRVCDMTIAEIAETLEKRPYSSREFIEEMAAYLERRGNYGQSVVQAAYQHRVPIFVPAFSDCSAGFGLVHHQWNSPESHVSIDSVREALSKFNRTNTNVFVSGDLSVEDFDTSVLPRDPYQFKFIDASPSSIKLEAAPLKVVMKLLGDEFASGSLQVRSITSSN
ncbi:deoxyhypusine synthase family protein [Dolichospermum sp. ST_sed9]|nr:deoxyhypusine synthase family protein [Dolichospermum sp. ST_sed9]